MASAPRSSTSRAARTCWSARCCAAGRSGLRRRRHLLQQRRLPRHVRPRHDRPGRDAAPTWAGIGPGEHRIETPVGIVDARRCDRRHASRSRTCQLPASHGGVRSRCRAIGAVTGDVAWGGNWFFLVERARPARSTLGNVDALTDFAWRIRAGAGRGTASPAPTARRSTTSSCSARRRRRRRQPQLRALSRQGLRPLALRHRHQRQARLPGRRRQARARATSGGRRASSAASSRRSYRPRSQGRRAPDDHRPGLRHRRRHAAARSGRPVPLGHSRAAAATPSRRRSNEEGLLERRAARHHHTLQAPTARVDHAFLARHVGDDARRRLHRRSFRSARSASRRRSRSTRRSGS